MANATQREEQARIILGLLESVERDGGQSQRHLAADLGIALGLVNAYLRRCIKKGLVKASQAPARRYIYYLTPQGFSEKSRLAVEYLSYSFSFFRQAKADCTLVLESARAQRVRRIVLAGKSDLAEIAIVCAPECDIVIAAVVDATAASARFAGVPLYASFDAVPEQFDAVLITDLVAPEDIYEAALDRFGEQRVFLPGLLRLHSRSKVELGSAK